MAGNSRAGEGERTGGKKEEFQSLESEAEKKHPPGAPPPDDPGQKEHGNYLGTLGYTHKGHDKGFFEPEASKIQAGSEIVYFFPGDKKKGHHRQEQDIPPGEDLESLPGNNRRPSCRPLLSPGNGQDHVPCEKDPGDPGQDQGPPEVPPSPQVDKAESHGDGNPSQGAPEPYTSEILPVPRGMVEHYGIGEGYCGPVEQAEQEIEDKYGYESRHPGQE